jgi:hypothetical protein
MLRNICFSFSEVIFVKVLFKFFALLAEHRLAALAESQLPQLTISYWATTNLLGAAPAATQTVLADLLKRGESFIH